MRGHRLYVRRKLDGAQGGVVLVRVRGAGRLLRLLLLLRMRWGGGALVQLRMLLGLLLGSLLGLLLGLQLRLLLLLRVLLLAAPRGLLPLHLLGAPSLLVRRLLQRLHRLAATPQALEQPLLLPLQDLTQVAAVQRLGGLGVALLRV